MVPESNTRSSSSIQHEKQESKLVKVERWARASGHSITTACKCVKCGLQINLAHNATTPEGILTMPCVGTIGQDILKHTCIQSVEGLMLYNNIEAHSTHALATSGVLKLHFCVACGCFGATRSHKLKQPCKHSATKAGKAALAAIAKGNRPRGFQGDKDKRYPRPKDHRGGPWAQGPTEAEKVPQVPPSPLPAGNRVEHRRAFSTGTSLPLAPTGSDCTETVAPVKRRLYTKSSSPNKRPNVCLGFCDKDCPKEGWTIDQFCEVCHSVGVPGAPPECPLSLVPSGPLGVSPSDLFSSPPENTPLHANEEKLRCIKGNGLCPKVGWAIDDYCPLCHG